MGQKISIVIGTRPQIIKSAPVIKTLLKKNFETSIIHTGQHYDYEMNKIFFEEFNIPDPDYYLGIGSGSHGYQIGEVIKRVEEVLIKDKPDLVVVPGDTNSAVGAAIASAKLRIITAHLEAGLRIYNPFMQEEMNRRIIDHISHVLFAPTNYAYKNLLQEGIEENIIFLTGDTMLDAFLKFKNRIEQINVYEKYGLEAQKYFVMTLHRDFNTDYPERLKEILEALIIFCKKHDDINILFLVHPRTKKRLVEYGYIKMLEKSKNIILMPPTGYFETLTLVKNSIGLLTDSGGMQKEAFILGVDCITFRSKTEWLETVEIGVNTLVDANANKIIKTLEKIISISSNRRRKDVQEKAMKYYGDGEASERIVKAIKWAISNIMPQNEIFNA